MENDLKKSKRKYGHKMTLGDTDCEIFSCKYNLSDQLIAAGFGDGAIRVYNTQTVKCEYTFAGKLNEND